jgi:glycolate oxidase iron-sulfur subunit
MADRAMNGRSPTAGIDRELLAACVHCGFCLPSCPTYVLDGEEADSPRGRIQLMSTIADEGVASPVAARHLDRCLSCMACVTACPSGVEYGALIESARVVVERNRRPFAERLRRGLIFSLFPYPNRLRRAHRLLRLSELLGLRGLARRAPTAALVPRFLRTLEALAPSTRRPRPAARAALPPVPTAESRARVGLLRGCVQGVFFPEVNAATERVLAAEGFEVVAGLETCCGALSSHSGRNDEAQRFARVVIDALPPDLDAIVVNAAGCGSAMKEYGRLLADDPVYAARAARLAAATVDVTELLASAPQRAERHPLEVTIAYHDACHLAHAQQLRDEPRRVLREVPGLELAELAERDICCGSAGVYNLLQPERAGRLGARKAASVTAVGAELLVSGNPGCLMQLAAALRATAAPGTGRAIRTAHTIEVIDASIRGLSPDEIGR